MKTVNRTGLSRLLISLSCLFVTLGHASGRPGEETPSISFRLALETEAPNTTKMQFQSPNEILYVSKTAILEAKDLLKARVEHSPAGAVLIVTVTSAGAKRLNQTTSSHLGDRLAVVVNGILISAPTIRQVIEGNEMSVSSSRLAESKIEDLAQMINNGIKR